MSTMLVHEIIAADPQQTHLWCVVLHGLGDSIDGWRPVVSELAAPGLGFVLVQAPMEYVMGWSWYQIPMLSGPDATPDGMRADIRESRELVVELMHKLQDQDGIPIAQQLLMGFSQGCCMVLETALRLEQRCAGVVGISGTMTDFEDLPDGFGPHARSLPILQTHGTDDQVVPLQLPERSVMALRELGVDVDFRVYPKAHTLDPYEELPDLRAWIAERLAAVAN